MSNQRVWGIILSSILVFSTMAFAAAYSGGDGSQANPYQINTVADWQEFTNVANAADWSKYIILTGDIDFEGAELTPVAPDTDSSATGFQGTPFKGVFDGQGFILRNAVINKPGLDYIGVFGQINGYACQIRNLNVENIQTIGRFHVGCLVGYNEYGSVTNCSSTGESVGNMNIGGLIGMNNGAVHSCHSRVVIGGEFNMGGLIGHNYFGNIGHCYSKGEIITGLYGRSIGGLVGLNQGDIFYSYAANPLRGVFDNAGGLIGENSGSIAGSYASDNVEGRHYAGGLVGQNSSGSIGSSYAVGAVKGANYTGGLAGKVYGRIRNCYAAGQVAGDDNVGGLVGHCTTNTKIQNCYAAGFISGVSNVGGLAGVNSGTIGQCFWDIQTSGQTTSAGGTGLATSEMKTHYFYAVNGWDFNYVWSLCSDTD